MGITELEEAFLKAKTAFLADKSNKKLKKKFRKAKKAFAEAKEKAAAEAKEKAATEEKSKKRAAEKEIEKSKKKKVKTEKSEEEEKSKSAKYPPSKTLWVSNLSFSVKDDDIINFFKDYGQVDIQLRNHKYSGLFTGRAEVGFESVELATKAKAEKQKKKFMGRRIEIRYLNPKVMKSSPSSTRSLSKKPSNCTTVFIGNIPSDINKKKLSKFFGKECGDIVEIRFLPSKQARVRGKYAAFVEFKNPDVAVDVAVGKNGQKFEGKTVRVDYAKSKKKN